MNAKNIWEFFKYLQLLYQKDVSHMKHVLMLNFSRTVFFHSLSCTYNGKYTLWMF